MPFGGLVATSVDGESTVGRLPRNASRRRKRNGWETEILENNPAEEPESQNPPDIAACLRQVREGDLTASSLLFERFRPQLTKLAAQKLDQRLSSRVDASDIVQEALLVAARDLPAFATSGDLPFSIWLYRLVWQRLHDAHRFHGQSQRRSVYREQPGESQLANPWFSPIIDQFEDSATGPLSTIERHERRERLHSALESLEPSNRELLRMKYDDGLTMQEIGEIFGISEAAAKMRHLRILQSLRRHLEPHGDESS